MFGLAFALRLLFWAATPDRAWPGSAWYDGDARGWITWAGALRDGAEYEQGLPFRPPGAAYLIVWLAGGEPRDAIGRLKVAWCALGALAAALFAESARRGFGAGVGLAVGLACAGSTGLMILSTSLNNETPYLVLVAATLVTWGEVRDGRGGWRLGVWGALHGLACLVRVEHVLVFAGMLALAAARWRSTTTGRGVIARLFVVAGASAVTLAPWHVFAWEAIRRFNDEPRPLDVVARAKRAQTERALAGASWSDGARTEVGAMPAAVRDTVGFFVAATALTRGIGTIEPGLPAAILDEAFGYVPRPLPAHPFVSLYGPLNFHLGNHALASGGFDRSPLDRPPRLAGGAERFPRMMLVGLPPPELALTYPPHLRAVADGYRLGFAWIRADPGDFARLATRKLAIAWSGAALGLGGYDLPLGFEGVRRSVDLAVPEGSPPTAWRLAAAVLALVGLGVGLANRRTPLAPWLAYGGTKVVVTIAFFGYARQGASVVPVLALLGALAVAPLVRRVGGRARVVPIAVVASVLLVVAEAGDGSAHRR
ncbi:MAG: hypothetical protein IPK07_28165 [Deltaproteobacteria bacterium]|nr:hypothetical protein [Deltaproteobacteria bacterium]